MINLIRLNLFVFYILATSMIKPYLDTKKCVKFSSKEAYTDLKKSIASVKESCGEVCDQTITGKPGKYFEKITKNIQCPALFSMDAIDLPSKFESPPMKIPKWLRDDFR